MRHYTKVVLTVIALSVLSLPIKAEEKVWYCQTDQNLAIFSDSVNQTSGRFKLKVTPIEVEFGENNFTSEYPMPMLRFDSGIEWIAVSGNSTARFRGRSLSFVTLLPRAVVAVLATCEEF